MSLSNAHVHLHALLAVLVLMNPDPQEKRSDTREWYLRDDNIHEQYKQIRLEHELVCCTCCAYRHSVPSFCTVILYRHSLPLLHTVTLSIPSFCTVTIPRHSILALGTVTVSEGDLDMIAGFSVLPAPVVFFQAFPRNCTQPVRHCWEDTFWVSDFKAFIFIPNSKISGIVSSAWATPLVHEASPTPTPARPNDTHSAPRPRHQRSPGLVSKFL